jgi:hypothetical protein
LDVLAPDSAWVFDEFADALAHLRKLGKRVVVLLSSPNGHAFDPKSMIDHGWLIPHARQVNSVARAELVSMLSPIDSRIRAAAERAGAEILEPLNWSCNNTVCPVLDSIGRPIFIDGSHIRASVERAQATALDQLVVIGPLASAPRMDKLSRE